MRKLLMLPGFLCFTNRLEISHLLMNIPSHNDFVVRREGHAMKGLVKGSFHLIAVSGAILLMSACGSPAPTAPVPVPAKTPIPPPTTPAPATPPTPPQRPTPTRPAPPEQDPIQPSADRGLNLLGVSSYSAELPFADYFKQARNYSNSSGQTIYVMGDGIGGHFPAGTYVTTWEGTGEVTVGSDASPTSTAEHRIESTVTPSQWGITLTIKNSNPADPVRNVHMYLPGMETQKSPFNPSFLSKLAPFSTLRFTHWQHTNGSPLKTWADRPTTADLVWSTDKGVPLEILIELCNETKKNCWVSMPHMADDNYVKQFAAKLKDTLNPNLKVYIEYSNEVWNDAPGFQEQYNYARQMSAGLSDDPYLAQLRFFSQRTVQIVKMFKQALGNRAIGVMSSNFEDSYQSEQQLSWQNASAGVDVLSVAPYFGGHLGDPEQLDQTKGLGLNGLFETINRELKGIMADNLKAQSDVAKRYHVTMVAYEGGQGLKRQPDSDDEDSVTRMFEEANRDQRMYDLYVTHLKNWSAAGGGFYCLFGDVGTSDSHGSWGLLEYQDQVTSPKWKAATAM